MVGGGSGGGWGNRFAESSGANGSCNGDCSWVTDRGWAICSVQYKCLSNKIRKGELRERGS